MFANTARVALLFVGFAGFCPTVSGQITWNVTYDDGAIRTGGTGFADPTVVGSTTLGQLRRDTVTAAFNYLNTVLDGRGTTNLEFQTSANSTSTSVLAFFGPSAFANIKGSFQNGSVYQAARTNLNPFGGSDGSGQFNFGYSWNYAGQTPNSNFFDMTTVAIHEITHGLGFLSGTNSTGQGITSQTVGSPDVYSGFDRFIQRGNSGSGNLLNTDITSTSFGSFTGPVSTLTNGNNSTTGLFFGGQYTREVLGTSASLFAPNPYQSGSSTSHVNDSSAVMNPDIAPNIVHRFQPYEIAMLLDIGWNVYNWKPNTTGNWLDGVNGSTLTVGNSHWQTDSGIVYDGTNTFNTHSSPGQAPVLPPYGQVTSNIVLNFAGSGGSSSAYVASNDIGNVRIARLNLNSTATVAETIQNTAGNSNGTLIFGLNSDGTASVLAPKIVQQGSGAFAISLNIQTNNVATVTTAASAGGVTFPGSPGLTIDGTGTGQLTLSGVISGGISSQGGFNGTSVTGSLTKSGSFTAILTGNNTYGGGTTINAGALVINGQTGTNSGTGSGAVTVAGGTLGGTGSIAGPVTVNGGSTAGGTIRGGFSDGTTNTGTLTIANNLNIGNGSANALFQFEASRTGAGTANASLITLTGSNSVLNLNPGSGNKFLIDLVNGPTSLQLNESYTVTLAAVATAGNIQLNGTSESANSVISASSYTLQSAAFGNFSNVSLSINSADTGLVLQFTPVPVPEPAAVLGIAFAVLGLGAWARRRGSFVNNTNVLKP